MYTGLFYSFELLDSAPEYRADIFMWSCTISAYLSFSSFSVFQTMLPVTSYTCLFVNTCENVKYSLHSHLHDRDTCDLFLAYGVTPQRSTPENMELL